MASKALFGLLDSLLLVSQVVKITFVFRYLLVVVSTMYKEVSRQKGQDTQGNCHILWCYMNGQQEFLRYLMHDTAS